MPISPSRELSTINFESMLGGPLVAVINAQAQAAQSSINFIKSVGFNPAYDSSGGIIEGQVGDPIYVKFKYPKEVAPYQPAIQPAIVGIVVTAPGSGYTTPPNVTFASQSGETGAGGAKATAVISNGQVASITLDLAGDYTLAPTVSISGGGGSGATANVTWQAKKDTVPAQFADMMLEVPILTMLPIPFIRIEETTIDFNAKINSIEEAKTDSTFKLDTTSTGKASYPPLFSAVTAKLKISASYQRNTQSGYKVDRTYSMSVHIRAVQDEMPAGTERILGILEDAIKSQPLKP